MTKRISLDQHAADIVRRYEAGDTLAILGKAYGVATSVIRRTMLEAGVTPRTRGQARSLGFRMGRCTPRIPRVVLPTADVVSRYEAGKSVRAIADELRYSHEQVRKCLVAAGVTMRPTGGISPALKRRKYGHHVALLKANGDDIKQRYESGEPIWMVAKAYNMSAERIRKAMHELGVVMRPTGGPSPAMRDRSHEIKPAPLHLAYHTDEPEPETPETDAATSAWLAKKWG